MKQITFEWVFLAQCGGPSSKTRIFLLDDIIHTFNYAPNVICDIFNHYNCVHISYKLNMQ